LNDFISNADSCSMSFGRYLKSIRSEQKIPIESVAQEIRVSIWQLTLIESEDHDQLPDEVYVKGILRAYAKFIGVDPDDIVDRYIINRSAYFQLQQTETGRLHRRKNILPKIVLVLLTFVTLIFIYFIYDLHYKNQHGEILDKPEVVENNSFGQSHDPLVVPMQLNKNEKLFLRIDGVEDTIISIIIDSGDPTEYVLNPMDHVEFEASSKFEIQLNNAAGVKMFLNDHPVTFSGKSGDMIHLELP